MKKTILILAVALISCKKEKDVIPVKFASVSFYNGNIREKLTITVNGNTIGKTTLKPLGFVPDCSTDWTVKYSNTVGLYSFKAMNNDSTTIVIGQFEVKANECILIPINK